MVDCRSGHYIVFSSAKVSFLIQVFAFFTELQSRLYNRMSQGTENAFLPMNSASNKHYEFRHGEEISE
jgi:hypothetical protein